MFSLLSAAVLLVVASVAATAQPPAPPAQPTIGSRAKDPFIGEWQLNPSRSTFIDQMKVARAAGNQYVFDLGAGMTETIAVDGTDQPGLAGSTLSVASEGPRAWKVVRKKDGRMLLSAAWKLSEDGQTLTDDYTEFGSNGSSTLETFVYKRTDGMSGFVGTWQRRNESVAAVSVLKVTSPHIDGIDGADVLSFTYPVADITKNVRFDGKAYPTAGRNAAPGAMCSARRVNSRTLELTDTIDGNAADTQQLVLSPDLETLTITVHPTGRREPNVMVFERR